MNIVAILWLDSAHIHFGWSPVENLEYSDPIYCISVGLIIEETDEHTVIVQSSDVDGAVVSNSLKIPKISIIDTKKLVETDNIKWKKPSKKIK
jgi:hypothetical protein